MFKINFDQKTWPGLLCLCLLLTIATQSLAQTSDERMRALSLLWDQSKPEDALPLLEKLAEADPKDG